MHGGDQRNGVGGPARVDAEEALVFDEGLAGAFTPEGVSVFGDELPVTVYVQPEGWDEEHPMLVGGSRISRASCSLRRDG